MIIQFLIQLIRLLGIGLLMLAINIVHADPGKLVDTPLFASTSNTPPNVFFEVDDSGSMDWELLSKPHWGVNAYNCTPNHDCGGISLITNGLFVDDTGVEYSTFRYIYENDDNVYENVCTSGHGLVFETCSNNTSTLVFDWRVKSSTLNVAYYNPTITYSPWEKGDGTIMEQAVFTTAKSNPQLDTDGYTINRNLTGFVYHIWTDTHGFQGDYPNGTTMNKTTGENGLVDWWDEHLRYTVNASSIIVDKITYTGRGTIETATRVATLSGGADPLLGGKTVAESKQNIANWYQYYRKRSFVAKSAIAKVITENPTYRYGLNFINNTTFPYQAGEAQLINVPPLKGSKAYNTEIISSLFKLKWPGYSTPLRAGLHRAGQYFKTGSPAPIVEECQKSFAILFTDGYWNAGQPSGIGDKDGDGITGLNGDITENVTVADVARYYYEEDLSASLDKLQNMVTFTVAFGVKGSLIDTDADGWPNPVLSVSSSWGNPWNTDPSKIDDLWHAAFNADGKFVSAETPEEVVEALEAALIEIGNRIGSAASAAFSSTTLTANSAVFLAQFDGTNNQWTGDLKSFLLEDTGELATNATWSAATQLEQKTATNRKIFSYNDTEGIPFVWDSLADLQQNDLRVNPDGTSSNDNNDAKAKARLNFLRGERSNEVSSNGSQRGDYSFRRREKLLGDIIHSAPIFVGEPELFWPSAAPFPTGGAAYNNFKKGTAKNRAGIVYAGANDGMLHGFYSENGEEALAYIPKTLFATNTTEGLHYLTDTTYKHRYYVDMSLTVSDVYIAKKNQSKKWRTILIGSGRKGSRGLFALDVTDPTKFNQSDVNAKNLVLWEFDHVDDADLGFTFSQPSIARMNNGRWAAIFGNGYNSSGDGTASLFIVFLDGGLDGEWEAGTDYIKLSTKIGTNTLTDCSDCNGLSTPQSIDINSDKVVDRVYAGDLQGNLWVFDVSSTEATNWKIAYGTSIEPKPLFIAKKASKPQPITLKPILVEHPEKLGDKTDVLVFFGTGQYLVDTDPANQDLQSFYGIWDNGEHSLTQSQLVEQTFLSKTFTSDNKDVTNQIRVLTDETIDYSKKYGWFIDLNLIAGERVIVDPDIRGDLVFFNTWIPDSSPCGSGGSGFLMAVKQINGGAPSESVFDLNDNGNVDGDDEVTASGETYVPSGQVFNLGLPASSSFLNNRQYTPGTNGGSAISSRTIANLPGAGTGRLSWQELRP
jgi:type IV pilus assembly protein PilY1